MYPGPGLFFFVWAKLEKLSYGCTLVSSSERPSPYDYQS